VLTESKHGIEDIFTIFGSHDYSPIAPRDKLGMHDTLVLGSAPYERTPGRQGTRNCVRLVVCHAILVVHTARDLWLAYYPSRVARGCISSYAE
jgi:hypothetical protein